MCTSGRYAHPSPCVAKPQRQAPIDCCGLESDGIIGRLGLLMQHQQTLPTVGSITSLHCEVPRRGYPPETAPVTIPTRRIEMDGAAAAPWFSDIAPSGNPPAMPHMIATEFVDGLPTST
jgi:hypothetical protein